MPSDPIKRGPQALDECKRQINAAMRLPACDIELARKIAYEVGARLHADECGFIPELAVDDLAQEGVLAIRDAWPKYNAKRGAPSTFMWGVAWNRMKTIIRGARRRVNRDASVYADLPTAAEPEPVQESDDAALAEWVTSIMATVRMVYVMGEIPLRHRFQNKGTPDRVQRATLILLVRRQGWSYRRAAGELERRPALLAALGLQKAPKYVAFHRAGVTVSRLQKNLRAVPTADIQKAVAPFGGK